jgi:hypothetical protein
MFMEGEIRNAAGELLAHSKGLFIEIDPIALFAKQTRRRVNGACPVAIPPPHKRKTP